MNRQNPKVVQDSENRGDAPQRSRPGRLVRLAWLPIPLLAAAIIAGRVAGLRESYTSETLTLVLSLAFYTLASLGTLFLIGRSFLELGTPGLLLLECGVVLWSLAGTVGDAVSHGNANVNVTIFNAAILLAGLCHFAGAILSLRPQRALRDKPLWLGVSCVLSLAVLWLVAHAALANWLPVFFIPGQGGTLVRYCVLISAIIMFALSAFLLLSGQRIIRTPFTSWYALALLLLAVGLFGVMVQLSLGSVVNWLGRTAQWLGGVYLLLAAIAAVRESDIPLLRPEKDSRPERYGYAVAVTIVLAATAVRLTLSPLLGMSVPFLTFYPAVILAALYGGARAGLLSTILSALIVDFFWIEPVNQFTIGSPADWVGILFFILSCMMISFVIEAMRKATARLVLYQDHLEESIKNRTADLEREVVERKEAEDALQKTEERLRLALEAGDFGTWDLNLVTGKAVRSLRHDQIFGYEELQSEWSLEIALRHVLPEDHQKAIDAHTPAPGKTGMYFEGRMRRTDGSIGWIMSTGRFQYDGNGRPVRVVGVCADITERKRAEEALQHAHDSLELRVQERTTQLSEAYEKLQQETREREKAENQLRQAQKMEALGTLAGGIAHDFNNLLGAVIGFTELIQEDLPVGNPGHRHATRVMEAGLRGRDLVKQMLTFSRKTEQDKKPLRLSTIVKESAQLLRASIPTTISINVNVASESGVILADPVQIQQVVMNLCTNAYQAMLERGGILDIELSDYSVNPSNENAHGIEPGLYMRLTVRDTGIGIPVQVQERIFDPFFTTKVVGKGTGLGLSVVMGIVKQSRGHITVESEPGKGSTFSVYFPKVTEETVTDAPVAEETLPNGSEHILFVDDEDALLEMGEQLLTKLGYKVTSENSSAEALALIEENPSHFDLVITDQTMPEMTGVELAGRILTLRPDLPVILCTGFSHLVDADSAKAAGIKGFAMKPLTKRETARTVRNVLDGKSSA